MKLSNDAMSDGDLSVTKDGFREMKLFTRYPEPDDSKLSYMNLPYTIVQSVAGIAQVNKVFCFLCVSLSHGVDNKGINIRNPSERLIYMINLKLKEYHNEIA